MHHSTHGKSDGHHWYADFIVLCFVMSHFKDLSQAHTISLFKKYNSKIPTFTPCFLNQNIESLNTICRLQENKMLQKNGHHWSPASTLYMYAQYLSRKTQNFSAGGGGVWFRTHSNVTCIGKGVKIDPTNQ